MWNNHAGVQPLGNLLFERGGLDVARMSRVRTLGTFAVLPDALICRLMLFLTPDDLAKFCQVSSACRAFGMDEDLWRAAVFAEFGISFVFFKSWRKTYIRARFAKNPHATALLAQNSLPNHSHTNCVPFYSDVLFHKWRCLYALVQPKWIAFDNADRISPITMTVNMFREQYEEIGLPVVITDVVTKWPAFKKWNADFLNEKYARTKFHAGGFEFPLGDYINYCIGVRQMDDQILTIFDKKFVDKAPEMAEDYVVPRYFEEDLFSVFDEDLRPDYRWLIIGPERSGSSFHKDPNCTSAWNGVVTGRKKWLLFPPASPPPGVIPSEDGGNVTGPVSVMEWFLNYYDAAHEYGKTVGAVECVVKSGEMMFVPAGWWHIVLNLDFTIAITQNYASSVNVVSLAKWLKYRPGQISGCASEKQKQYISLNFARLVAENRPDLRRRLRANQMLTMADGAVYLADTDEEDSEPSGDDDFSGSDMGDHSSVPKEIANESVPASGAENGNCVIGEAGSKQVRAAKIVRANSSPGKRSTGNIVDDCTVDGVSNGPANTDDSVDGPAPKKQRVALWESLKRNSKDGDGEEGEEEGENTKFSFGFQV